MKKFLALIMLGVMLLGLVGCGETEVKIDTLPDKETIETFVEEKEENLLEETENSGTLIYDDMKDVAETSTERMDTMLVDMTNSLFTQYAGEKVRGIMVLNLIEKIDTLGTEDLLPIPLSFEYKDDLNEETIDSKEYYRVEILDTLPEDSLDGYFDLVLISKAEVESGSGE